MRSRFPLLLSMACAVAQRPPLPTSRQPRFTVEAEQQRNPDLCRRMAEWDCIDLDCPDCSSVAKQARTRDVGEVAAALAALGFASVLGQQSGAPSASARPFADALDTGGVPAAVNGLMPATREASEVDSCRATCRRCAASKLRCR